MSDVVVESEPEITEAVEEKPVVTADERIAHRGPIQRLLVSPEIGAIIGAVLVWTFFWGNGAKFGTAASTLIILDAAAPLGIMAVVVALLMIGGEFDLSAGMITGATGIMVGLMVKYFHGTGSPMWVAIAAAFVLAGAIGFFNGTLVNKTGLPSFIVTLATFFVLKGVTLVLAKRLEHKVAVADVDNARGYRGWYRFFAQEYKPQNFTGRDVLFFTLSIAGGVLLIMGLSEQSFIRRKTRAARSGLYLLIGLVGIGAAAVGFVMLHKTDGVNSNLVWGGVAGVGAIAAVTGLCLLRYQPRAHPENATTDTATMHKLLTRVLLGIACFVLACLAPVAFDRNERRTILNWAPSGLRVLIAVMVAVTGVAIGLRQWWPRLRETFRWYRLIEAVAFSAILGLLLLAGTLTFLQLTTVQALRAIAMMTFTGLGLGLLLVARGMAGKISARLQLAVGSIPVVAIIVLAFVVRADSGAVRFRSGLFGSLMLGAVVLAANTLLEYELAKRQFVDASADKWGRRLLGGGFALLGIGLAIRVIFTNLPGAKSFSLTRMSIIWWMVVTLVGAFVLAKTKWGNWIFAVGGNKEAARAIGVPANRVKTALFMTVSLTGCFVGIMVLLRYTSVQASQGDGQEFLYIIAAVVGGCLMTGGYGSVIGASVGALILIMSDSGIASAGWNQDGKYAFKGVVLLIAVLVNNVVRKKAQEAR
jgi:ribose/xylose/arabinose/galactoside ABC-type transport system permease subunit